MSEPRIRIGTVGFPVDRKKVLAHVDVVELTEGYSVPPLKSTAKRWRAQTPDRVAYSMQLPRYLFEPPPSNAALPGDATAYGGFALSEENLDLWKRAVDFARGVQAKILVLKTPVSFSPAKANVEALTGFLSAVDRTGFELVWDPAGPWEPETAAEFVRSLGFILAVDPLRDEPPPGEAAYFKLGPFAVLGTRFGVYDLERLAQAATPYERATVVFDTPRALEDARNLKKVLLSE